jgi:hypothetical protein
MINLKVTEQKAVAEIQKTYDGLSDDAKQAVANGVSWAERHIWDCVIAALVLGIAMGAALAAI